MMQVEFPNGVWPVMLTPFTLENHVDFPALGELVEWYIQNGVTGLFAVCQSSEMFFLSLEERVAISRFVAEKAAGRVPVVASGHVSDDFEDQVRELNAIAETGVDAVVLLTNRLAAEGEPDEVWIQNMDRLLERLDERYPLGLYECPYPYKRVISQKLAEYLVKTGRFSFLKDTSCDIDNIRMKLRVFQNSGLKLYNANTSTLRESLQAGAAGYCGVMANFHPRLYVKMASDFQQDSTQQLSDELTMLSFIEKQLYPVNAKYYLEGEGVDIKEYSRTKDCRSFSRTFAEEVEMLRRITRRMYARYLR